VPAPFERRVLPTRVIRWRSSCPAIVSLAATPRSPATPAVSGASDGSWITSAAREPDVATYPHQTERLTEALERAGLEALVATTPENVAYLTGFRSLSEPAFAVFTRQGTALVVPVMSLPSIAADAIGVDHVECFGEAGVLFAEPPTPIARRVQAMMEGRTAAPADALAKALERLASHRGPVGVDEDRLTHDGWQRLRTRLT